MTIAQKKPRRDRKPARRAPRKPAPRALNQNELLARLDALIRELEEVRQQLQTVPKPALNRNLVDELFGAAGRGSRDEYDSFLDYERFGTWQTR